MTLSIPLAIFLLIPQGLSAQAEKPKPAYDFALAREEKIKLAESAAPAEISGKAAVYILERTGYVKVRDGSNVQVNYDASHDALRFVTA